MTSNLFPLPPELYERYLPTAFDESLTILQKINKLIEIVNAMIPYFPNLDGSITDNLQGDVTDLKNSVTDLLTRMGVHDSMWTSVNGSPSAEAGESVYLKNDTNLFGYKSDGTFSNLATMEQNDIAKLGDSTIDTVWLMANLYLSLRAQNNPSYQKIDSAGNPIEAGRTLYHQGNNSYHVWAFGEGTQTLTKLTQQALTFLTNVNKQFPVGSFVNGSYTIPRNGMYNHSVTLKVANAPLAKGVIRVSIAKTTDGVTTVSEYSDLHYDPTSYATPFLTCSFQANYSKDDVITLQVEPKNEDITIETGTRFGLYILGDTIQS